MEVVRGARRFTVDFAVFVAFLLLYLYTRTSYFTFDSINYALSIRYWETTQSPRLLFHPHHLLFNGFGVLWMRVLRLWDPGTEPLEALQVMNAFLGACGVVLVYRLVRRVLTDTSAVQGSAGVVAAALASAAAVGTSFGYWIASTDGRANIPGVVAALAAISISYGYMKRPDARQAGLVGLAAAVAALFHQSHGLLASALPLAMAVTPGERARKLRHILWFFAVYLPAVIVPYVFASYLRGAFGLQEMIFWATSYAHKGSWWSFDLPANLWRDVYALAHSYIAARTLDWTAGLHHTFRIGFVIMPMAIAGAFAYRIYRMHLGAETLDAVEASKGGSVGEERSPRESDSSLAAVNAICLLWALVYAAFFTVWCPGYFAFWIPMAVAGVVLVVANASVFVGRPGLVAGALFVWTAAVASANLTEYVIPRARPENNPQLVIVRAVERNTKAGDTVILTGTGYLAEAELYIPYFAGRNAVSLLQIMRDHGGLKAGALQYLERRVEHRRKAGYNVYILTEALRPGAAWKQINVRSELKREDLLRTLSKYRMVPAFRCKDQIVYRLTDKAR